MKYFIALLMTTAALQAEAGNYVFQKEVNIPAEVEVAIDINNSIGRDHWDSFSVHMVKKFMIFNHDEVELEDVLTAIVSATKDLEASSFYEVCEETIDNPTSRKCAQLLLKYHWQNSGSLIQHIKSWTSDLGASYEEEQFKKSIYRIKHYVQAELGKGHYEIEAITLNWVADTITTILISRDLKSVLLISRNEGA